VLCRYRSEGDGPGKRNAWLIAHLDGLRPVIACGSWRTGEKYTLALDRRPLSPDQLAMQRTACAAATAERDRELRRGHESARRFVQTLWDKAPLADPDHPYLTRKGIGVHGARQNGGKLLIPMRDADGVLWNVQGIRANGDKRFERGRVQGLAAHIGDMITDKLLICEGWATACSLHEATGALTFAAMSAGNLAHVAQWLRAKYPDADITICADNDFETERRDGKNPGIDAARAAATAIGAKMAIPGEGFNDFNDQANGATRPRIDNGTSEDE
jgi:putative DNA primase/helicase